MRVRPAAGHAVVLAAACSLFAGACSTGERPVVSTAEYVPPTAAAPATSAVVGDAAVPTVSPPAAAPTETTVPAAAASAVPAPTTTTPPVAAGGVLAVASVTAPTGVELPRAALDPAGLAEQITTAELGLRDPSTPADQLAALGRLQQVAYRKLSYEPGWDDDVLALVPTELVSIVERNVFARRQFLGMHSRWPTEVPDWRIQPPADPDDLLSYYHEASDATGIDWAYLAAINLVETGMGRIHGLSSAGAQGPMQFLPSTFEEVDGDGVDDIDDPRDAILAAARYLVRRGGPDDMDRALWGFNNHDNYVRAVSTYADLMREDERAFYGFYHWEIFFLSELGDVWLPVGYEVVDRVPIAEYLDDAPWSEPPAEGFVPLTDPLPVAEG